MDLSAYVENLRRDLIAAAAAGTDDTRRTADLLATALEPAVRLSIMDALSAATADITAALSGVTVEVRLHGREPRIAVDIIDPDPDPDPESESPAAPPPETAGEDAGPARVTLRLPESVKTRAEEAAGRAGVSVNSWLVRAVTQALDGPPSSGPGRPGRRLVGYARG